MFIVMLVLFATAGEMALEINSDGIVLESKFMLSPKNDWQTSLFAGVGIITFGFWAWFWSRYFLPEPPLYKDF
ncbi:MAG: hypothetical protein AAF902_25340 [Chloroflexota bacterium]